MHIKSKMGQRLGGLLVLGIGLYFTYDELKTAVFENHYHRLAIVFPAFVIIGLGTMFFPLDYERYKADGQERPEGFHQFPDSWKLMTVLGVAAALAFWALLEFSHHPKIFPHLLRLVNSIG